MDGVRFVMGDLADTSDVTVPRVEDVSEITADQEEARPPWDSLRSSSLLLLSKSCGYIGS